MTISRIRKRIVCVCSAFLFLTGCGNAAPASKPEETLTPQTTEEPETDTTVASEDLEEISKTVLQAMEEKMTYYREAFEQTSDDEQRKELYENATKDLEILYFDACDKIDKLDIPDETKDQILDLIAEKWGDHVDEVKNLYGLE